MKLTAYTPHGPYCFLAIGKNPQETAKFLNLNASDGVGIRVILMIEGCIKISESVYCKGMDALEFAHRLFSFEIGK